MSDELLNASKVQQMIKEKGFRQNWVIQYIGLKPTTGNHMIRNGVLPKDDALRKTALERLAKLLGVDERQLILRLKAKAG
jgi:hypothetical protein